MSLSAPDDKEKYLKISRDELRGVIRQAWAAGNEAKLLQSNWGRSEGAREMIVAVLARFEARDQ